MAFRSMTGFGRSQGKVGPYDVTLEVKSVNHRFSEFTIRLPREWAMFEDNLRSRLQTAVSRGRVDLFVNVADFAVTAVDIDVNWPLLDALLKAEQGLVARLCAPAERQTAREWLMYPGVLIQRKAELDEGQIAEALCSLLDTALAQLVKVRCDEGARLAENCQGKLAMLETHLAAVQARGPLAVEEKRQTLARRIAELGIEMDPARMLQEVLLFAERSAIDEELVRLQSHIVAFREAMANQEPVGRRLDFLVQEMHRETNTIGAKSADPEIAQRVVEMKVIVEQLREQVQNIE
ncbi:hypothetical protein URH17368_1552 [Alicyclobacillus hesperidum URH17-3-68]|uniref:YicC/YloC family endoribonuclease n=1 Tax=Alicyclobacillus hesperidum TaxID=89784 RepID=UPI000281C158|nr:YicC/YloC family endoribonuclease [Alicyclobacillus hesperidum]EJY55833.1 hypothetical protein URH17368_1552 [Alicyclobacillus hesperidum URH17-3-68]